MYKVGNLQQYDFLADFVLFIISFPISVRDEFYVKFRQGGTPTWQCIRMCHFFAGFCGHTKSEFLTSSLTLAFYERQTNICWVFFFCKTCSKQYEEKKSGEVF